MGKRFSFEVTFDVEIVTEDNHMTIGDAEEMVEAKFTGFATWQRRGIKPPVLAKQMHLHIANQHAGEYEVPREMKVW